MIEEDKALNFSESHLGQYLELKIFECFRDRFLPIIRNYANAGSKDIDIYNHIFLAPQDYSRERNFELKGVLSPFVCMWRTTPLTWNIDNGFYARSVLPRTFTYVNSDGEEASVECFLYDLKFTVNLYSSSYYKDFRDRLNQDILDIDRLRYFDVDVKELLPKCDSLKSRFQLQLGDISITDTVKDGTRGRSFDMAVPFTCSISLPYSRKGFYFEKINLFVNERKIYSKDLETGEEIIS